MATTITANGINFPDGSAGSPSIGGTDTNTGLFTGSDIVGFATGGSERLRIDASGNVNIANDSGKLRLGTGADLQIYHDGTHSRIKNDTGTLFTLADEVRFKNNANNETLFVATANGAVELYHDNSKKFETTSGGAIVTGSLEATDDLILSGANANLRWDKSDDALEFMDNGKAVFGTGDDLQIYHDGSDSHIDNATSNLRIKSNDIQLRDNAENFYIDCNNGGSVDLYYNGSKKFETTAQGIDVSGAGIFHSNGVSNALDIEQQTDANYQGISIRNFYTGSAKNMIVFLDNFGNVDGSIVINNSTTTYNTSSDYRLKENEVLISNGIERLKQLKPYRFNWKRNPSITLDGFFAHEAATVVPEAVTGTKDAVVTQSMVDAGEYTSDKLDQEIHQGIDQSKLVPLLVAAVQELTAKVEALEAA